MTFAMRREYTRYCRRPPIGELLPYIRPDIIPVAMNTARVLRAARHRACLSQSALARSAGTSQATVSAYETAVKHPSVATLDRLLAAAGSRLTIAPAATPFSHVAPERHAWTARALADVLSLADALPTRYEPRLRFPRLPVASRPRR